MVTGLANNIALLLALVMVYGVTLRRVRLAEPVRSMVMGLAFGTVAVVGMLIPVQFASGLVFDGRSVVLSAAAIMCGPVAATLAALLASACRITIGGSGLWMGLGVIWTSVLAGTVLRHVLSRRGREPGVWAFLVLGYAVHAAMLVWTLLLPAAMQADVRRGLWPVLATIYPLGTVALGLLLKQQETDVRLKQRVLSSQDRYRELVDNMRSGVAVYRAVDHGTDFEFVEFNRAAEAFERKSREEVVGRRVTAVFPGVREMGLLEVFARVWQTGRAEDLPLAHYLDNRLASWRDNHVYKLPSGEIVAVYDDVTSRKQAEEQVQRLNADLERRVQERTRELKRREEAERSLRETAARLELAIRSANMGTWELDLISGELTWDEGMYRIYGVPPDRFEGAYEAWRKAVLPDDLPGAEADLQAAREGTGDFDARFRIVRPDGSVRMIRAHACVLRDDQGGARAMIGTNLDVTQEEEREDLRRQSQRLQALGTLAGGVAHEINNPINGIMNYAQLILDRGPGADETPAYAQEIIGECERVAGIVRNLLAFSRREQRASEPCSPAMLVQATLSLVRTVMRHDTIRIDVDVPEDLPVVPCRYQQVQQVLMNLLTNARDALREFDPAEGQERRILVRGAVTEAEGEPVVRLTVENNGPAIPEPIRERLFDPFFTTKPRERGTGLGLAISHGIVKEHGGRLWVESETGSTRFHVDLPLAAAQPARSAAS